jgi:hypothetical protein
VLAWLGQAALRRGDPKRAEALYRQALEIEPDYDWVCRSLLPELAIRAWLHRQRRVPGGSSPRQVVQRS